MNARTKLLIKIAVVVLTVCAVCFLFMKACSGTESPASPSAAPSPPLSSTEGSSIEPTKAPDYDFGEDIESAEFAGMNLDAAQTPFSNHNAVSYHYGEGNTISVGIDDSSLTDGIYLNISCSEASKETPIGFYVLTDSGFIMYASEDNNRQALNDVGVYNVLLGRTYDLGSPSEYANDVDYGCKWLSDAQTNATLYIRAFRLGESSLGQLVATICISISYNEETRQYAIDSANSSDVNATEKLTSEERDFIVQDAVDFMGNSSRNNRADMFDNLDYDMTSAWATARRLAVVEYVPMTYFTKFYGVDGKAANRRDFIKCDVYAVCFPLTGFGTVTMYYAPALQVMGMTSPYAPGSTDLNLELFGYDAFYPFTQETLDNAGFLN